MVQDGVFGPERKSSSGRPKWRLVDESLGQELDMSSMYCTPVRSKAVKKTVDADKEEWDILDGSAAGAGRPAGMLKSKDVLHEISALEPARRTIRKQPMRARSAIKPMGGKLAVVTKPALSGKQDSLASPQRLSPSRRPHRYTPPRRMRLQTPRFSPKWSPKNGKRGASEMLSGGMSPPRKARKITNAGSRRCALQS